MHKFAALALVFSAQAFACPNLTGTYTCTYQDNTTEQMVFSQEEKNGVTVYTENGAQIPADNVSYPVPDDTSIRSATFRAWCSDELTLSANLVGQYFQDNQYFGDLNMTTNFSLTGAGLKQITTGTLKNQGGEYPVNSEVSCVRNP